MLHVRRSSFGLSVCFFFMLLIQTSSTDLLCLPLRLTAAAAPPKKSQSPGAWAAAKQVPQGSSLAALLARSAMRDTALVLRGGAGRGAVGIDYGRFDALECSDAPGSSSAVIPRSHFQFWTQGSEGTG